MKNILVVNNLHIMLLEHICVVIYSSNVEEDSLLNITVFKDSLSFIVPGNFSLKVFFII